MNAEHLRKLKHELRTPVNHILGYSELLMETANDDGDSVIASLARDIHERGRILASLLEKNLLSPTGGIDDDQMGALHNSVRPAIKEILAVSFLNPELPGVDSYAGDFGRIREAATQLMLLVQPEKTSASE